MAAHSAVSAAGGAVPDEGFHTARDRARPELLWFMRHSAALGRWPVLEEDWALRVDKRHRAETSREGQDIAYLHGAGR